MKNIRRLGILTTHHIRLGRHRLVDRPLGGPLAFGPGGRPGWTYLVFNDMRNRLSERQSSLLVCCHSHAPRRPEITSRYLFGVFRRGRADQFGSRWLQRQHVNGQLRTEVLSTRTLGFSSLIRAGLDQSFRSDP